MVVYTGKTVKDAVQQASRSLHRPEAALKVEILEQPRRGFLGIGRRQRLRQRLNRRKPSRPRNRRKAPQLLSQRQLRFSNQLPWLFTPTTRLRTGMSRIRRWSRRVTKPTSATPATPGSS